MKKSRKQNKSHKALAVRSWESRQTALVNTDVTSIQQEKIVGFGIRSLILVLALTSYKIRSSLGSPVTVPTTVPSARHANGRVGKTERTQLGDTSTGLDDFCRACGQVDIPYY